MKVEVLGPGCANCEKLVANTRQALQLLGMSDPVEKVTRPGDIASFGMIMTPALAIDGKVVLSGKVATPAEIQTAVTSVL